jgi:multidrug efflux system membrane fusion protein
MLSIQRLDPIYVDFTATESDLPAIRRNMAAGTLKVFARIPNDGPATTVQPESTEDGRQGMLTFMDNAVANVTGTIKLRATMPNADHFFWPGQFVRVRLILKTIKDVPVIPADALQLSQQGTFVYVIGKDMTVQQRPVKVGQRQGAQGELLAIDSGVKAGEKVVVTGQLTLGPGAPVIISQGAGTQPVADAGGKP